MAEEDIQTLYESLGGCSAHMEAPENVVEIQDEEEECHLPKKKKRVHFNEVVEECYDEGLDDFEENAADLQTYIELNRNPETVKKTRRDITKLNEFLREVGEGRNVEDIPAKDLDIHLGRFLLHVRKADGSDYEPTSLTSMFGSVKRYLEHKNYGICLMTDPAFSTCRKVLESRRKQLKSQGMGNKPNKAEALSKEEENMLWEKKIMTAETPRGLRNALWYVLTKCLGFRGRQESRQLKWGDLTVKKDSAGETYIEFNERITKTRQGDGHHERAFCPKLWKNETHPERCPIFLLEEYEKHRPASELRPEAPFFLTINHKRKPESAIWYSRLPMGANEIGKVMRLMAEEGGLVGKKTNHSVRKTSCTSLMHANVDPVVVAQLSGHKSVSSLANYSTASYEQQKEMYKILADDTKASTAVAVPKPKPPLPPKKVPTCTATRPDDDDAHEMPNFDLGNMLEIDDIPSSQEETVAMAVRSNEKESMAVKLHKRMLEGFITGNRIENTTINININL